MYNDGKNPDESSGFILQLVNKITHFSESNKCVSSGGKTVSGGNRGERVCGIQNMAPEADALSSDMLLRLQRHAHDLEIIKRASLLHHLSTPMSEHEEINDTNKWCFGAGR